VLKRKLCNTVLGAGMLFCLGPAMSFADVIVTPGNISPFNVVLFSPGDTGTTITGSTIGGFQLDVIGSQALSVVAGQHIEGQGGNFTNVTFEPVVGTLDKLIVNFNVTTAGSILFSSAPFSIVGQDTFNVAQGENFFTLTAINGQNIASVTAGVTNTEIVDVRQIRVLPTGAVPEPETVGMMLAGLGTLALGLRRKKV
jgi:hypothetical protein